MAPKAYRFAVLLYLELAQHQETHRIQSVLKCFKPLRWQFRFSLGPRRTEEIPEKYRTLVLTLGYTGMRQGEQRIDRACDLRYGTAMGELSRFERQL